MPLNYPVYTSALDPDVFRDSARASLLASSTVTALAGSRIFPDVAPEGTASPWVTLSLPSTVVQGAYQQPILNSLMDISCYSEGWSTTAVRALLVACLAALMDTPLVVAGYTVMAATNQLDGTGWRTADSVVSGVMTRGRAATIRILALKMAS